MKRKIPSQVRITHKVTYQVCYADEFPDSSVLGMCNPQTKQILIRTRGQTETKQFSTFVHELFHAMSFETLKLNLTETQVLALEHATMRIIRLNKDL